MRTSVSLDRPVLIFDGYCSLCNGTVDFVMRHDKKQEILFTANQHEAGREILEKLGKDPENVETVYFVENGQVYERSTAALKIARKLGFPWSFAYTFMIIPSFIRDAIYKVIAANRYNWFGKKNTCRIPTPEEKARFLA